MKEEEEVVACEAGLTPSPAAALSTGKRAESRAGQEWVETQAQLGGLI